jgi:hypothetical protein
VPFTSVTTAPSPAAILDPGLTVGPARERDRRVTGMMLLTDALES